MIKSWLSFILMVAFAIQTFSQGTPNDTISINIRNKNFVYTVKK